MKKLLIMTFLGLIFTTLSAQDYTISFVGSGGENTIIDSIEVENINTGEILSFPGNQVFHLEGDEVGVRNLINNDNGDIKIYPNPITESSTIEFTLPKSSITNVEIFDILGKEVSSTTNILDAGRHSFNITGLSKGIYAIKVYSNEFSCTSKLMSNSQTSLKPVITYNGYRGFTSSFVNMKSVQDDVVMQYREGDRLKITAKSGVYRTTITEIPDQSKEISIPFMKCLDADVNNYSVVRIGDQFWTVENLKTTKYNDGTPILYLADNDQWSDISMNAWSNDCPGVYCNYDNIESNAGIYGRLYNWHAVNTGKLAPKGWHVPTKEEWTILVEYLIANGYNYDGTKEGNKIAKSMASKTGWGWSSDAGSISVAPEKNNSTGFTSLPSGYRNYIYFVGIKVEAFWWSSTENINNGTAYSAFMYLNGPSFGGYFTDKGWGYPVRLVSDSVYVTNYANIPVVNTKEVSEITHSAAKSGGSIISDGGATVIERGICWSKNQVPTIHDNKTTGGIGEVNFKCAISGLIANTTYYVRAYATNSEGTGYGSAISFTTLESNVFPEITYGTMTDIDGNNYKTVQIGSQVWMAENLKTTKYNDGTPIPNVIDGKEWDSLTTGAYCNYDNLESNAIIYGRLYNWHAVNTGKLAPAGWHVPTNEEWNILENYLINNGYNYDGTKEGNMIAKSLCAKTNWELHSNAGSPGNAPEKNNSSGFSALPGGVRFNNGGAYAYIGRDGRWWSSTEKAADFAYEWSLGYYYLYTSRYLADKIFGHSIRLVKD